MAAPWNETALPTILSRCAFKDIFNVDKFGLFYQILPCKTKHFKSQECSCGKHSKVCLNGLAAGNAFGERMQIFVIEISHKPRCFKGVKYFPCRCLHQLKSWVSYELLQECVVHKLDHMFGSEEKSH